MSCVIPRMRPSGLVPAVLIDPRFSGCGVAICCNLGELLPGGVHPGGVAGWVKVVQCGNPGCGITRGDEHVGVADCLVGAIRFDLTPWLVPPIIQSITDDSGSDPLAFGLVLW